MVRAKLSDDEKSDDVSKAKNRALDILERCDRTERELREKLSLEYLPEAVDGALDFVREYNFVDDERYAVNYVTTGGRMKSRRQAEQYLVYKKGISRDDFEKALARADMPDERVKIRYWMDKRQICPGSSDPADLRRFYQSMLRKGFNSEDILHVMHERED